MGERHRVALGAAQPREHPIGPRAHLRRLLAAGTAVAPQVPVRVAARGSAAWSAPRTRRSPTRAGRRTPRRDPRSRPARRSRAPAAAGCVSTSENVPRSQHRPQRRRALASFLDQRQVGAAGVLPATAPLGLAMPDEDDLPLPRPPASWRRDSLAASAVSGVVGLARDHLARLLPRPAARPDVLGRPDVRCSCRSSSSSVAAASGSPQMLHSMTRLVMTRSLLRGL